MKTNNDTEKPADQIPEIPTQPTEKQDNGEAASSKDIDDVLMILNELDQMACEIGSMWIADFIFIEHEADADQQGRPQQPRHNELKIGECESVGAPGDGEWDDAQPGSDVGIAARLRYPCGGGVEKYG